MRSDSKKTTDVVIIGGGIIGLTSAYELSRAGLSVRLLERNVCGQEASWAGAGVLQCGRWHRKDALVHLLRESVKQYGSFTAELRERTGIDPEYIRCGSFEMLLDEQKHSMATSEVTSADVFREEFGEPVLELLSPEEARRFEPEICDELLGVNFCRVTSQVRNPRLLQAVRCACLAEGVDIIERCAARELAVEGDRVVGVVTDNEVYRCGHVVLAAGAWSSLLDSQVGQLARVYPVKGQIMLLELRRRPFSHVIEKGKCYLVPRLDGKVVVGATEEHDAGYDKSNTAQGIHSLLSLAQKLVPCLAEARVIKTWAGLRPGTPDRGPYLGPVAGYEGLIAATGHFRSGLILAPVTAQIVTELITTGTTGFDIRRFATGRAYKKPKPAKAFPS